MYHPRRNPRPYRAETSPKHVLDYFKDISLFYNLFWAGGGFSAGGTPSPRRKPAHIGLKLHQNMSWTILRIFYFFAIYSERGSSLPKKNPPPPVETPAQGRLVGRLDYNFGAFRYRNLTFLAYFECFRYISGDLGCYFTPKCPKKPLPPPISGWKSTKTCFGRF